MSDRVRRREPSWLHLGEDEEIVWHRRPHAIALGIGALIGVSLVFVGLVFAGVAWVRGWPVVPWLGLALAVVGGYVAGVRYLHWTNTRYVITTEELYEKRGWISRNVTQFRIDRIQNTSLEQSAVGLALGYADLTVYTAGSGDPELTFTHVPEPGEASAALSNQLGEVLEDSRRRAA